jgi:hypothetical protein
MPIMQQTKQLIDFRFISKPILFILCVLTTFGK